MSDDYFEAELYEAPPRVQAAFRFYEFLVRSQLAGSERAGDGVPTAPRDSSLQEISVMHKALVVIQDYLCGKIPDVRTAGAVSSEPTDDEPSETTDDETVAEDQ